MEQYFHGSAHYVMWNLKSKFPYSTSKINSAAFHEEEASGLMAAVSWPPRSYSCSFCQRDFRSAQALGGHMNVHRRDRAKLNQQNHNNTVLPKPDQPTFIDGHNCVETRLSVGINYSYGSNTVICKSSHSKMFTNPMEDDDDHEDIDLELRLGDSPTLK